MALPPVYHLFLRPALPSLLARALFDEVWSVDLAGRLSVAVFVAVGLHPRLALEFLLCLDKRERMVK